MTEQFREMVMGDPHDSRAAESLLSRIPGLHSAPHVAQKITEIVHQPLFNVNEVVACLETDPALSLCVMARYFERSGEKMSAGFAQAAKSLGQHTLRRVGLDFSFAPPLLEGEGALAYSQFRRRSILKAVCTHRLAQHEGLDAAVAYASGLLSDVGVLALLQLHPETYAPLLLSCDPGSELLEEEHNRYGCRHTQLGAELLKNAGFPEDYSSAALLHHNLESVGQWDRIHCVGEMVAGVLHTSKSPHLARVRAILHEEFGLDTDAFITFALQCQGDMLLEWDRLEANLGEKIDCRQLLSHAKKTRNEAELATPLDIASIISDLPED